MKNRIKREWFIFRSLVLLLARDFKKYYAVAGMAYITGVVRIAPAAKPAYFFCRYLDDYADGEKIIDRPTSSFEDFITSLKKTVLHPQKSYSRTIDLTIIDAIKKLSKQHVDIEIVQHEFLEFLGSMLFDYRRRTETIILTEEELLKVYDNSFKPILHIALIGLGVDIKEKYIFLLGRLQGKLYAIQDLHYELSKGIFNIPKEVVASSGMSSKEIIKSPSTFLETKKYKEWENKELIDCRKHAQELRDLTLTEKKSIKMMDLLIKPLEADLNKRLDSSVVIDQN